MVGARRQRPVMRRAPCPGVHPVRVQLVYPVTEPRLPARIKIQRREAEIELAVSRRHHDFLAAHRGWFAVHPQFLDEHRRRERGGHRFVRIDADRAAGGGEPQLSVPVAPAVGLAAVGTFQCRQPVVPPVGHIIHRAGLAIGPGVERRSGKRSRCPGACRATAALRRPPESGR